MIKPTPPRRDLGAPSAALLPPLDGDAKHRIARAERLAVWCLWLALCAPALFAESRVDAKLALPDGAKSPQATVSGSLVPDARSGKMPQRPSLSAPQSATPQTAPTNSATLAHALPQSRQMRGALQPVVRATQANDSADNPLPLRAMFPRSAVAAKANPAGKGILPPAEISLSASTAASITRLSSLDLSLTAPPTPRSDTAMSALPFVWKGGRAQRPATLLADARGDAATTAPLPALAKPAQAAGKQVPGVGKMGLVIDVAALKLPPAPRTLPPSLQSKAVSADTKFISSMPRLAQAGNMGSPVRPPSPTASNQIEVTVSTFVVLVAPDDLQTVAVADPNIADVVVINSRAVLVNGKSPGATSLVIVDKKIRQYHVRVVPSPGDSPLDVTSSVANAINLPNVQVRSVRGAIVLDGTVANAEEKRMAASIAGLYSEKVVDLLQVRPVELEENPDPLPVRIKNAIRNDAVQVRVLGNTILLEGQVLSEAEREAAEAVATALGRELKVVNLLQLPAPPAPAVADRLTIEDVVETLRPVPSAPVTNDMPGMIPAAPAPASRISVRQVRDQIILEGTAANQAAMDQALAIAARTGLNVVNRLEIAAPAAALPAELQQLNTLSASINRAVPGASVIASGTKERLVLTGSVPSTNGAVVAEQIARSYSKLVDNLLLTPRPQQVDVDISVVEIVKNDLNSLGLTFNTLRNGFVLGQAVRRGPFQVQSPLQAILNAEVTDGRARLLSNPRTTVLSGRTATFKVGGEVPIPVGSTTNGAGTSTTISFKPFGILLDVTPVVSDDGVVTMQVRTEVSQPDVALGIVPPGGGGVIPGFSQRQAQTEVTIEPGGTLALGGLIQNNSRTLVRKVPLLGNIPVLGALFTSKRFQKDETELVIFVTPRVLENKLKEGTVAPARPASTGETFWVPVPMGIPGIQSFTEGSNFGISGTGTGGGNVGGGG